MADSPQPTGATLPGRLVSGKNIDPMEGYRRWQSMSRVPTGRQIKYEDGSTYLGELVKDNRHGKGKYTLPSGSVYEGEFQDDNFHGYARFEMAPQDGEEPEIYEGEFRDGEFHGAGQYLYVDGAIYVGEWQEGMMHGFGRYFEQAPPLVTTTTTSGAVDEQTTTATSLAAGGGDFLNKIDMEAYDGDYYEGEYHEDEKHGYGLYIQAGDNCRYEGEWCQGVMHGRGVHFDSKDNRYEGEFQSNTMHGTGLMSLVGQDSQGNAKKSSEGHHNPMLGVTVDDQGNEILKFECVVEGRWVNGERVDGEGKVLHRATDPSSNKQKADERATKEAEEQLRGEAEKEFRHKDSRVPRELPDEAM